MNIALLNLYLTADKGFANRDLTDPLDDLIYMAGCVII